MSLVLLLTGVFLMIWAGSRGPIIAFLCGYMYLIIKRGLGKSYKQLILYALIGMALIILMITVAGKAINIRLIYKTIQMIEGKNLSEKKGVRIKLYKNLVQYKKYTMANIFGMGLGSYDLHSDEINGTAIHLRYPHNIHFRYPHNILLEIYFELGWIGIILFTYVFVVLPVYLYKKSPDKTGFLIVSMAIYICVFINSLFSGNLKGNEMLPKMLILLSVAAVNSKNSALTDQGKH
jgi:O-antigen ligase